MLAPIMVGVVLFFLLREPLTYWRQGERLYDEQAIQEWVREARVSSISLPEMLKEFLQKSESATGDLKNASELSGDSIRDQHRKRRDEIREMLQELGRPT